MNNDIIADVLNRIMNAKKSGKKSIKIDRFSKVLIGVLDIMKNRGYIDYVNEEGNIKINILDIVECKAIKPRYTVDRKTMEKYVRRFLPSRNFGFVVVSTNKGLLTHREAKDSKIGGSLIAYFY